MEMTNKKRYTYKQNFTAKKKNTKGESFRRVFDEGFERNGHAIGVNEYIKKSEGKIFKVPVVQYQVEDTMNNKNNKIFGSGSKGRRDAILYAERLKKQYEN